MSEENESQVQHDVDDEDIVILADEDGNEGSFVFLTVLDHAEENYALLAPLAQMQDEEDEQLDVYIFRYSVDDAGDELFEPIDDEALIDSIGAKAEAFFAEVIDDDA